jgi:hypothetical protein
MINGTNSMKFDISFIYMPVRLHPTGCVMSDLKSCEMEHTGSSKKEMEHTGETAPVNSIHTNTTIVVFNNYLDIDNLSGNNVHESRIIKDSVLEPDTDARLPVSY